MLRRLLPLAGVLAAAAGAYFLTGRGPAPALVPAAPAAAEFTGATAVSFRYARNVRIEVVPGGRVLVVRNPWHKNHPGVRVGLVPRGAALLAEPVDVTVFVPIARLGVTTTTMLPFLDQLDAWDCLVACSAVEYAWNPRVHELHAAGKIAALPPGERPDPERLAGLRLDAYADGGLNPLDAGVLRQLADLGAAPIPICEFAEEHPLGRAEWLKVFGALLGKEAAAAAAFDGIAARYEALAAQVRRVPRRPKLLVNAPYRGEWFLPAAGNNFARLLADAGAAYPWAARTGHQSLALDLEEVLRTAADAEVWLNPGTARSLAEVKQLDSRLAAFAALAPGKTLASDRRLAPNGGGSDFWETAQARPDLYLADLVDALHPGLLPGHRPLWVRRLP